MEPPLPRQMPVVLAVDLGHHAVEVAAFGNAMAVAAMGGGDAVLLAKMQADADRGRFLARVEMRVAGDLAARHLGADAVLEHADGLHEPVGFDQRLAR